MAPTAPKEVLPEAWNSWLRTFRYPTDVIYHYTSADALLSIINSKRMWATDLHFTNDPTDLVHGERVVGAALDRAIAGCSSKFVCEWLDGFKVTTRRQLEHNDHYAISFCTNGDLLSQWRAYGALGGGFAMGWSPVSEFPEFPYRVGVTYDETLQSEVAQDVIAKHVEYVSGVSSKPNDADVARLVFATGSLGVLFAFMLHGFKHPAFASEDEFRWVYSALDHKLPAGQKRLFRRFGSLIKPYIEVDFSRAILVEIIFGPTTEPLTLEWLRSALDSYGFEATAIRPSSVPMRAV